MPTFPRTKQFDSFKRAEENPLGSKPGHEEWKATISGGETGKIGGEQRYEAVGAGESAAYWSTKAFSTNNVVALTLASEIQTYIEMWVCISEPGTANVSGYLVKWKTQSFGGGLYKTRIERCDKGVFTLLKEEIGFHTEVTTGDKIGITVGAGKVISWRKHGEAAWEESSEAADATYTEGFIGIGGKENAGTGVVKFEGPDSGDHILGMIISS